MKKKYLLTMTLVALSWLLAFAGCATNGTVHGNEQDSSDTDSDGDTDGDSDGDGDCDEGESICQDDLSVLTCADGEWTVTDTCEEGSQLCMEGVCEDCESIEFAIETQQSCSIDILDGFEMDGEGFIHLEGEDHRVFAMDRWGEDGHVIAWCDSTTMASFLGAFNVVGYLGQVDDPVVVSFGHYLCDPGAYLPWPEDVAYLGQSLPAVYQGNPAQMAADFDVLIFCGFGPGAWSHDWVDEIASFVTDHGKGFLAVMEYESVALQTDFDNMSAITSPAGIVFEALNLDWAPTSVSVEIDCVPDLPPVIE